MYVIQMKIKDCQETSSSPCIQLLYVHKTDEQVMYTSLVQGHWREACG